MNETLLTQFDRSWSGFVEITQSFTEQEWRTGEVDYLIPARAAYHILETADFYSGITPADFPWGQRFDCDWEGGAPETLPAQTNVMVYLEEVKDKIIAWLRDVDLMAEDDRFTWCGGTIADRALYVLRHNHHHIGEMWSELKRRGHDLPDWQ